MPTLKDSFTTVTSGNTENFSSNFYLGQTFTTTSAYASTSVKFNIGSIGTKSGDVHLYAVDGSSLPTGPALATVAFDNVDFTNVVAPGAQYEFIWVTPVALTNATEYAVVVQSDINTTSLFLHGENSNQYADGQLVTSVNGTSWSGFSLDFYFEIYGVTSADFIPSDVKVTRKLVTFSANKVFTGSTPAGMTELTAANGVLDMSKALSATEAYGKVFIVNGTRLKVADFINVKITTASLGSSANAPNHGTILTGGSSGAKMSVDYINADTGDTILYGSSLTTASFTNGETVTGTNTADYSAQIAEAMPYDAFEPRLILTLDRLLNAGFTEPGEPAEARTELAFRNIFYHMRNRPETPDKSEHQESGPAGFHLSVTSINSTEREQLVPGKSGAQQAKDELHHDRKSKARVKPW